MLDIQYPFQAEGHFAELAAPEAAAESKKKKSMALNFSAQFLPHGLERVFLICTGRWGLYFSVVNSNNQE